MERPTLDAIRAKAEQHQTELTAAATWFTPQQLAARWSVSVTTLKAIPFDELPYMTLGRGVKHKWRRYAPESIAAYEATAKPKVAA